MNILNVLTHTTIPGLSLDNLKRLVYLLEWDPVAVKDEEDDPFFVSGADKQWSRGGNGVVFTPTTYLNRSTGRRSAVYGVGIQVEVVKAGKGKARAGMNTVTRWLEGGDERRENVERKLKQWVEVRGLEPPRTVALKGRFVASSKNLKRPRSDPARSFDVAYAFASSTNPDGGPSGVEPAGSSCGHASIFPCQESRVPNSRQSKIIRALPDPRPNTQLVDGFRSIYSDNCSNFHAIDRSPGCPSGTPSAAFFADRWDSDAKQGRCQSRTR